jgi:hypothetical protein
MLHLSKTIFVYRFYKILVIEPTTEVKAESIGAPSVKEIGEIGGLLGPWITRPVDYSARWTARPAYRHLGPWTLCF